MKPVFFVQNNYVERLTVPVARYAHAHSVDLVDRSSSAALDVDDCGIDWAAYDLVLPYGSVQFIRQCKGSSLAPFILHDEGRFAAGAWMPILGRFALNAAGRLASVADLLENFGPEQQHLRPDSVDKAFVGGVHTRDSFAAVVADRELGRDLLCWASPLQEIEAEWRCWVIGGKVVEVSQYRRAGEMAVERDASGDVVEQASALAARYLPAECVVMDMALSSDGYSVIEYNPIHCSGWYAADVDHVLDEWLNWAAHHLSRSGLPALAEAPQ